jgi:hypothetical protein
VYWVGRAEIARDAGAASAATLRHVPGEAVVIEKPALDAAGAARVDKGVAAPPVAGRLTALERNHVVATVTAPADGAVLLAEAYDPRWTATVDGQPAHVLPANGMFRAVLVGPGAHTVEMRYQAPGLLALAGVELAALILCVVLVLGERRWVA